MEFQVEGTLEVDDYTRAARAHSFQRLPRIALTLAGIAGLLAILAWLELIAWWLVGSLATGAAIGLAIIVAGLFILLPGRTRKLFRQQKALSRPMKLTATDEGLRIEQGEEDRSLLPWSDCHRWEEDATLFRIYRSEVLFHMVPKRWLDADQMEALRSALRDKLPRS